ncbi:PHP domain-containing protein [Fusibacter ferrireducens]|uniref:PHP domain-containing protein n=1 Tax=Fusibacter ferrireducens TaxID=2785058 RepID=A0ABS0A0G8_9FIRM|nr:PHP domain-containing protein [Fusibacter ferrireducens]MBF4695389.1 PHP domain-containing protein [Fusibacter ferrireducens]
MKIDFHVHSFYSEDSFQSFEKIIQKAEQCGLDGVVILDHNTIQGSDRLAAYLETHYHNRPLNERLVVIRAGEYSTEEGHIIVIGLKEPLESILEVNQKWYSCRELIAEAKKQSATIILAHPFRWKHRLPSEWLLSQVDAIEVFNGRSCFVKGNYRANAKAVELAQKLNLPIVGGSDGHLTSEIGRSYVNFDVEKAAFDPQQLQRYNSSVHGAWGHPAYEVVSQVYKFWTQKKMSAIPKQLLKFFYGVFIYGFACLKPDGFLKGDIMTYNADDTACTDKVNLKESSIS